MKWQIIFVTLKQKECVHTKKPTLIGHTVWNCRKNVSFFCKIQFFFLASMKLMTMKVCNFFDFVSFFSQFCSLWDFFQTLCNYLPLAPLSPSPSYSKHRSIGCAASVVKQRRSFSDVVHIFEQSITVGGVKWTLIALQSFAVFYRLFARHWGVEQPSFGNLKLKRVVI